MKKFLSIAIITIACILGIASCAGTAGGDIGDGATAKLYFGSSRAAISFADLSDVVLKGSYEGGSEKVLMKWASGASMNGTEIEIKAGNWDFTLEATCKYQVSKATASKKLEPDTTNSVSFNISSGGTGVYKVPASALSDDSWFNTSSGVAEITVSGVTDANFSTLTQVIDSINGRCAATRVDLVIQGSVTTITSNAFENRTNLRNVTLPDSINIIESFTFRNCTNLESINLQNISTLNSNAFSGCSSLRSANLSSLHIIYFRIFENCTNLTSVTFSSSLTSIGTNAFNGAGLTSVYFPTSLSSIAGNAFKDCPLTSVTGFVASNWRNQAGQPVNESPEFTANPTNKDFFKNAQTFEITKN